MHAEISAFIAWCSSKNKRIIKKFAQIMRACSRNIRPVRRFNYLFFDLNGWVCYVGVQGKDVKTDTLTIWFCQGVSLSKQNPALELVWQGQAEGLRVVRKIKLDTLQDLQTYHLEELCRVVIAYNLEHNTHQERMAKKK